MTDKFKPVTPEEFDNFLLAYPRPLDRHLTAICEPPQISYNDFTLGNWPDSVVASFCIDDYLETDAKKYRLVDGRKETRHVVLK